MELTAGVGGGCAAAKQVKEKHEAEAARLLEKHQRETEALERKKETDLELLREECLRLQTQLASQVEASAAGVKKLKKELKAKAQEVEELSKPKRRSWRRGSITQMAESLAVGAAEGLGHCSWCVPGC